MKILFAFFIFCLVLFIYLHIQFHLKTADDLEVYEMEDVSKDKLEEVCDIRQPVLFTFDSDRIIENSSKSYLETNYNAFEIKIRNTTETDINAELYMPLPLHAASKLFAEDKRGVYYSENNMDFLEETGVIKNLQYNDEYLRPYMVSNCNYDMLIGAADVCTPFRYELNYRNFFMVTQGSVQIKMAPPKSTRYLYPINDYDNFEFRSPINPWSVQPKYSADFDKIKCLEFTLTPGKTIFIPAYWWYSFKFTANSSISSFKYRTYMNNIAIVPHIFMYGLQMQNVKRNVAKKADVKENNIIGVDDNDVNNENNDNNDNNDDFNNDSTNHAIGDTNIDSLPIDL